ncbi:hypothetical protein SAMN05216551_11555 [Chitinasiproducens palmae]|uniref:Uncharacterized protein n=1 Tax=Chitinasiproducens palmae TaxID=1770053 RepID=A0A1H2PV67_9BURK|nr:hypothetical protein SAMN05216551_11555 [Chitinasiproducens palmae]
MVIRIPVLASHAIAGQLTHRFLDIAACIDPIRKDNIGRQSTACDFALACPEKRAHRVKCHQAAARPIVCGSRSPVPRKAPAATGCRCLGCEWPSHASVTSFSRVLQSRASVACFGRTHWLRALVEASSRQLPPRAASHIAPMLFSKSGAADPWAIRSGPRLKAATSRHCGHVTPFEGCHASGGGSRQSPGSSRARRAHGSSSGTRRYVFSVQHGTAGHRAGSCHREASFVTYRVRAVS